jgi:hypothetical protein
VRRAIVLATIGAVCGFLIATTVAAFRAHPPAGQTLVDCDWCIRSIMLEGVAGGAPLGALMTVVIDLTIFRGMSTASIAKWTPILFFFTLFGALVGVVYPILEVVTAPLSFLVAAVVCRRFWNGGQNRSARKV